MIIESHCVVANSKDVASRRDAEFTVKHIMFVLFTLNQVTVYQLITSVNIFNFTL